MTIHTEVHYINSINKIYTANQEDTQVLLRRYNNPDDYAINLCHEFRVPYEFIEEILRVRKPL